VHKGFIYSRKTAIAKKYYLKFIIKKIYSVRRCRIDGAEPQFLYVVQR